MAIICVKRTADDKLKMWTTAGSARARKLFISNTGSKSPSAV